MEVNNRKAYYDYEIIETYEAGIQLFGSEIKSIRNSNVNLKDSYAIYKNGEIFILNMHISKYDEANIFNHDETRTRKLLLHKKEIYKIRDKINIEGLTLVPLKLYIKGNYAKLLIAVAKGKKNYDKRQAIKDKDLKRELKSNFKY